MYIYNCFLYVIQIIIFLLYIEVIERYCKSWFFVHRLYTKFFLLNENVVYNYLIFNCIANKRENSCMIIDFFRINIKRVIEI